MSAITTPAPETRHVSSTKQLLNKVPEVTLWFWVIKILCTTVGESFADWINMTLGVGLSKTALIFTAVLVAVLVWQFRTPRYTPFVYWLVVVVLSVTGTLYTDLLTDQLNVPLALSSGIFTAVLLVVFGIWYRREGTLSIKSITSPSREAYYWLAVLVTFALGTATGDWTLELTGWGPGTSVLLPAALIASIVIGWRLGANIVLSFWLAYILTRPLGANLGDLFASSSADHGLGVGTAMTSVIFLLAILATVIYLTITHTDVIETHSGAGEMPHKAGLRRERMMLGYYVAVAAVAGIVMAAASSANTNPVSAAAADAPAPAAPATLPPGAAIKHFPPALVADLRTITTDTLAFVTANNQAGARTRVKALETAWDHDQDTLKPLNGTGWAFLDGRIDKVLKSIRAATPVQAKELTALRNLQQGLS